MNKALGGRLNAPPKSGLPHVLIEPSGLTALKTQSSIYPHHIIAVAGYAVDGNTDGEAAKAYGFE
jgi:hypothetical protein